MKRFLFITVISLLTVFIFNILAHRISYARPGGGHSYSSSSSSSSSSSGSSSSGSIFSVSDSGGTGYSGEYVWHIFYGLIIGIPLLVIFVRILDVFREKRIKSQNLQSSPTQKNIERRKIERKLDEIKSSDPDFSKTLFLDFVASVYTKYYSWYGKDEFKNLSPYLTPTEIERVSNLKIKDEVSEIVIGSINITNIQASKTLISVEINANYTLLQQGKRTRYEVTERWNFKRDSNVKSAEPEKMRELACPQCGANIGLIDAGTCESCGTFIENGKMQWFVSSRNKLYQNVFETSSLAYYAEEAGTNSPTIYHPENKEIFLQFANNHNIKIEAYLEQFKNKIAAHYFRHIYKNYSKKKLKVVRHLLSDKLYESFQFWIDMYDNEKLTNKLDYVKVKKTSIVKLEIDKFYESVTVRIFASCRDYVIDKHGKVIGGSSKKFRKFSEYWTFIRRTGVETDNYDYGTCPNCGAIADKMGQSGTCEYCNTKISNGDFSWVLAVIIQDEVYMG